MVNRATIAQSGSENMDVTGTPHTQSSNQNVRDIFDKEMMEVAKSQLSNNPSEQIVTAACMDGLNLDPPWPSLPLQLT